MERRPRDRFLRRLGRALTGINAVEHGRPAPVDVEPWPAAVPTLTVDTPGGTPSNGARSELRKPLEPGEPDTLPGLV